MQDHTHAVPFILRAEYWRERVYLGVVDTSGSPEWETFVWNYLYVDTLLLKDLLCLVCFRYELRTVNKMRRVRDLAEVSHCWYRVVN